ncbi:hypothetical protein [Acinetobacter beijerinckii]|uniref:Uncharacterized protein n=1 Tax=Acinetobacter beijerinckii ANC 3835 TaxID=1217649 RepID=N9DYU1_9GAMM|nr:hypothetical protein [Acinetobacter beijerinckii]ENW03403.1 hypothetical protein F934_02659 [Acinetobacter beijerinckii ANC 3835]
MNAFDLKIRYPHQINRNDADHIGIFNAEQIINKFDEIGWRQQMVRQLQLDGASTCFIVRDEYTEQTLRISIDAFAESKQLEFKIDSDIPVLIPKKDLFGLVTRKTKETIAFKQLALSRAKEYLVLFLNRDSIVLEELYKKSLNKSIQTAS